MHDVEAAAVGWVRQDTIYSETQSCQDWLDSG